MKDFRSIRGDCMWDIRMEMKVEKYVAVIEMTATKDGKTARREYSVPREDSINKTYVMALLEGLSHINQKCHLQIVTSYAYLSASLNALDKWQEREFKTAKGKEVAYAGEWKEIGEKLEKLDWEVSRE